VTHSPGELWLADLRRALAIWRQTPALPIVSITVALLMSAPQLAVPIPAGCGVGTHPACTSGNLPLFTLLSVAALPVSLFAIGLFGAERWWYARVASGDAPRPSELWRASWGYFWQFVRLGLLVALLSAPVLVPMILATKDSERAQSIALAAYFIVLDIALTFVTPALALSTNSAWQALKTGVTALDRQWPRDALYAVVPPMALTIVTRITPDVLGSRTVTALTGAAAQVLTMLFAGAVTLLYIRDVDPDAVAHLRPQQVHKQPPLYAAAPGE
jgi:hypothetical protein